MHCHCLQDAEQCGYTAEDIQVSLNHCGDVNPVSWLRENWDNMMDTVVTLASNVGHEAEENTIGTLSKIEAKEALRKHKGNIWAAVTECVEQRQMRVRFFVHLFQVQSGVIHKLLYANLTPPPRPPAFPSMTPKGPILTAPYWKHLTFYLQLFNVKQYPYTMLKTQTGCN